MELSLNITRENSTQNHNFFYSNTQCQNNWINEQIKRWISNNNIEKKRNAHKNYQTHVRLRG